MFTAFAMIVGLMAPSPYGTIRLDIKPDSATVEIDGKLVQKGETKVKAKAGTRKIVVMKSGYLPTKELVKVLPGKTVEVKIRLKVAKKTTTKTTKKTVTKRTTTRGGFKTNQPRTTTKTTKTKTTRKTTIRTGAKVPRSKPKAKRPAHKPKIQIGGGKKAPRRGPVVGRSPGKSKSPAAKPDRRPTAKKRRPTAKKRRPTAKKRRKTKRRRRKTRPRAVAGGGNGVRDTAQPQRRPSTKPWAVLAFVVGGLAVTGGVVAGLAADSSADDFNSATKRRAKMDLKDDTENMALLSNVLYGVGATGLVLGGVLWAMDPADNYRAQVAPLPGGGAMVGLGGSF